MLLLAILLLMESCCCWHAFSFWCFHCCYHRFCFWYSCYAVGWRFLLHAVVDILSFPDMADVLSIFSIHADVSDSDVTEFLFLLTSVLIPVLLLCRGVSVVFSIHAAIDFPAVAGVLLLLTSLLIPVLTRLLLFSLLLSASLLWMVSLPFLESMLLLLGPSVVDISSIPGVSTFVCFHYVVGVPAVWLASLLFKCACCCWGFHYFWGPAVVEILFVRKQIFPPKMTSLQFVPSKYSWYILRRWQTDQFCHCSRCYRW